MKALGMKIAGKTLLAMSLMGVMAGAVQADDKVSARLQLVRLHRTGHHQEVRRRVGDQGGLRRFRQ